MPSLESAAFEAAVYLNERKLAGTKHASGYEFNSNEKAAAVAVKALLARPDLLVRLAIETEAVSEIVPRRVHIGYACDQFETTYEAGKGFRAFAWQDPQRVT